MDTAEHRRIEEHQARTKHWRRWGPYLSERQWGTVREDYSPEGDPWQYLTHDMAAAYAYRWGEDGIAGWSDNHQRLCFAPAFWNGQDGILKERLFGLTNIEGNHGEDVKECYWRLDGLPTHAYMKYLYRYPQRPFPYELLRAENARRGRFEPEFELLDTDIFAENRFFDLTIEYAKADDDDTLIRIEAVNHGPEAAPLWLLPMLWFRNTWRWRAAASKPRLEPFGATALVAQHDSLGSYLFEVQESGEWIFAENETNTFRIYGTPSDTPCPKDAFHRFVVEGAEEAISKEGGTKAASVVEWAMAPGMKRALLLRLSPGNAPRGFDNAEEVFAERRREADAFYGRLIPRSLKAEQAALARQAFAGLLWSKQYYHFSVEDWISGDPTMPPPDPLRSSFRNTDWVHLYCDDVLAMPDTWEFPWFAVWDTAFHAVALAAVDPAYAKRQLDVLTREWFMHPNGQLPAYEWEFNDVNPPVHAWATWRVYEHEKKATGKGDTAFLERVFHKLLMNFTWWVNRKDADGDNVFQGGFLGMDNIGVFDWSAPLPIEGHIDQSDCTSWMAMYCLDMLRIAWELAAVNPTYEDIASKFFEHFLYIAGAIHNIGGTGASLWDKADRFFYDQVHHRDGTRTPLRIRSMVGLIPLLAVEIVDHGEIDGLEGFRRRMDWFYDNRSDLTCNITCAFDGGQQGRCLLSMLGEDQLRSLLGVMLDEAEFLSPYGIRSLSKAHEAQPFVFEQDNYRSEVRYLPGESDSGLFGGNSNWRGPVWFPVNFLIIDALRRYDAFYGERFKVEFPSGSGREHTLEEVADALTHRLCSIFVENGGIRPAFGSAAPFNEPLWQGKFWFHEYFHGDTGKGLGASHQTGWTALLATLLLERENRV